MSSFRLNNSATYLLSLLFVYVGCIHADEVIFTELAVPSDQPDAKFIELYNGNRINDEMDAQLEIIFTNEVTDEAFFIDNGVFNENGLMTVCANQEAFQQAYGKECDYHEPLLSGLTGDSVLDVYSIDTDTALDISIDVYGTDIGDTQAIDEAYKFIAGRAVRKTTSTTPSGDSFNGEDWTVLSGIHGSPQVAADMDPGEWVSCDVYCENDTEPPAPSTTIPAPTPVEEPSTTLPAPTTPTPVAEPSTTLPAPTTPTPVAEPSTTLPAPTTPTPVAEPSPSTTVPAPTPTETCEDLDKSKKKPGCGWVDKKRIKRCRKHSDKCPETCGTCECLDNRFEKFKVPGEKKKKHCGWVGKNPEERCDSPKAQTFCKKSCLEECKE